ncbi:MAG: exosortase [Phycisphaerales bacterium]|nr:MAG: exosortase [Phycisphaerales bacterium]
MGSDPSIEVVILSGGRDFGRFPVAARLPAALWPVAGRPALERLVCSLAEQGVTKASICSDGDGRLLAKSIHVDDRIELEFIDEQLPAGTAGSLRNAARGGSSEVVLVLPAAMVSLPKVDFLLKAHLAGGSSLTVMLNPFNKQGGRLREASGICLCNRSVLGHIPEEGYFDIKEGLIPKIVAAGESVHAAELPQHAGNFRDRHGYLLAIDRYLEENRRPDKHFKRLEANGPGNSWIGANAQIHPDTTISGPVLIGDNTSISQGVVILGPAVIGSNVGLGKDSVIINSVIWDGSKIGDSCEVRRSLVDYEVVVGDRTVVDDESIEFKQAGLLRRTVKTMRAAAGTVTGRLQGAVEPKAAGFKAKTPDSVRTPSGPAVWLGVAIVLAALLWSYGPTLTDIWLIWQRSDEYSSGLLVPFLAAYVLWSRRKALAKCPLRPSILWGVLAFLAAQWFRFFGLFYMYGSAERLSLALAVAAIVLLLLGWRLFRRVFTIWLFLFLMLPWPTRVQGMITQPLQSWATKSAVFCLETAGYDVVREGNIIHIGQSSVAVAEACNGLRMVTAFFVISGLVVLLVKRAWWEKLLILASSLPIALVCNTIRLTITAVAFTFLEGQHWQGIFHDFGGYAMMPLALAAIVGELWLLAKLTVPPTQQQKVIITRQSGPLQ